MMDYSLGNAKKHAEEAGALNAAFHDRVSQIRDSLKTGRGIQPRQMEQKLSWACTDAKEGNHFMMDNSLGNAKIHAEAAGALNAAFHDRVSSQLRDSLKTGRDIQLRQMEQKLSWASKDAKEGNHFMMDYCLNNAKKHAEAAGALNAAFHERVSRIRDSLKTGRDFQHIQMAQNLNGASYYAKEGDRSLMDYKLGEARKHAEKALALNAVYYKIESQIRGSLKNERKYHLTHMEQNLDGARNYAKEGNRSLMDYKICEARKHAEKAGALNAAYYKMESLIRCSLFTGVVEAESITNM
jgi:hypothetical protein